jgi:hypothetical protein
LVPTPSGDDDFVGIGGLCERPGLPIVIVEESIDRHLEVDDGSEGAGFTLPFARVAKKPSTALSQESG